MSECSNPREHLLLIDDDDDVRRSIRLVVRRLTSEVSEAATGREGIAAAAAHPAAVLLDLGLPDIDGLEVLDAIKASAPHTPVVVISGSDSVDAAVDAMRHGAEDFITKPFVPERLLATVRNILRISRLGRRVNELESALQHGDRASELAGCSPRMRGLSDSVKRLSQESVPVLILGEAGTGKELVAHALHNMGPRADRPFVEVNCAMLGSARLLSEIFGDVPLGAPAGGRLSAARGGTLFIDSVGDMGPEVQVRLISYLESGHVPTSGPDAVRFVAASSRDLAAEVNAGRFRSDLYLRLAGSTLIVPPLRDRREDIPALAQAFLGDISRQYGRKHPDIENAAFDLLLGYSWPGNVREMENVLRNAFIETDAGPIDRKSLLPFLSSDHADEDPHSSFGEDGRLLPLRAVERRHLATALRKCSGNLSETARVLGIGRTTLYRKIEKYGLQELSRG